MSIIKHESIMHIPIALLVSNIIKFGTISPTHHLDYFEHDGQKPIVEASNNNGLKLAKYLINTSGVYAL